MPVEHETKHVLSLGSAKELLDALSQNHPLLEVEQFYVRLDNVFERIDGDVPRFVHKGTHPNGTGLSAVETEISEEDFELARLAAVADGTSDTFRTPTGNRFRRTCARPVDGPASETLTHTYKVMAGGRLLEIEREVRPETLSFARLGREESVCKVRFPIGKADAHWDVDFLLTAPLAEGGSIYFAMAEAETKEGADFLPLPELDGHVAFQVPHGRSAWFTNRKLADPDYAATVVDRYLGSGADAP